MKTLADLLNERKGDAEVVLQATRYWVGKISDHASVEEQREALLQRIHDEEQLDSFISYLARNPRELEKLSLYALSWAWSRAEYTVDVVTAVEAAEGKLPVIKPAILAIVVMYALYLIFSRGGETIHQTTVRQPDGSYRQEQVIEHASFPAAVEPLLRLLGVPTADAATNGAASGTGTSDSDASVSEANPTKHAQSRPGKSKGAPAQRGKKSKK